MLGAFLVFVSFQATGAPMAVVTGSQWEEKAPPHVSSYEPFVALCIGEVNVIAHFDEPGAPLAGGSCPTGERHPIAQVTRDSWMLVRIGWLLMVGASLWQMWLSCRPRLLL
ncbi:MAG TPA: hypothetical protein VMA98_05550 [Candidatus Acidoferrales bacterium]|nr:hypothetical protein [Candidatus Acidoferrales bacterium]